MWEWIVFIVVVGFFAVLGMVSTHDDLYHHRYHRWATLLNEPLKGGDRIVNSNFLYFIVGVICGLLFGVFF